MRRVETIEAAIAASGGHHTISWLTKSLSTLQDIIMWPKTAMARAADLETEPTIIPRRCINAYLIGIISILQTYAEPKSDHRLSPFSYIGPVRVNTSTFWVKSHII